MQRRNLKEPKSGGDYTGWEGGGNINNIASIVSDAALSTGTASPPIVSSPASPISRLPSVDSGYSASSDFSQGSAMVTASGEDFGSVEEIDQFLDTFHFNLDKDLLSIPPTEGGVNMSVEIEEADILKCLFLET